MQVCLVLLILFRGCFGSFAGFGNHSRHFKLGFVSVLIYVNSRRFHQAGMKKCSVGNEEMEAELMQEGMLDIRIFAIA